MTASRMTGTSNLLADGSISSGVSLPGSLALVCLVVVVAACSPTEPASENSASDSGSNLQSSTLMDRTGNTPLNTTPNSSSDPANQTGAERQVASYGEWASPVSAQMVAGSSNAVVSLQTDSGVLYWLEARPTEGGRTVLMGTDQAGAEIDISPSDMYLRTTVHEYGGTAYLLHNGIAYFSNMADQGLYAQALEPGATVHALSTVPGVRFADCSMDAVRNRLLCVQEDHRGVGEAVNQLVAVSIERALPDSAQTTEIHPAPETYAGDVIWQGSDFVAYPRLNPDGTQLAWIAWDHPNMPWDNTQLWLADVAADGSLANPRRVNEGVSESVLQPEWDVDGTLYVLADRSGWWNLYKLAASEPESSGLEIVFEVQADLGGPLWGLGGRYFALDGQGGALVETNGPTGAALAYVDLAAGDFKPLTLPFSGYAVLTRGSDQFYFLAGRSDGPDVIVALPFDGLAESKYTVVRENAPRLLAAEDVSVAVPITFPTAGDAQSYAYYYPPANARFTGPDASAPPLIVLMHGGPTAASSPSFSIAKQFWTSRGIAVVDVNYRGSTGFGRAYRQALNGQWGIADLEDAVHVTRYLVSEGLADPEQLLIRGGSAGGFTTLSALAFTDEFAAGANYFGVSDLEALAKHTHKFESRYLDSLVGPYPQAKEVYMARSPIHALEGFNAPLITFQGTEDKIVPPAQSERIYAAVKEKGTPTAYMAFEGEQHGFRKAENNIAALEAELYFYGKVLGFTPADELPEVVIDNLKH